MSLDVYLRLPACECCGREESEVFSANITHNLGAMAEAAGIYGATWRPDENGITTAAQLIVPLRAGIAAMKADPVRFVAFNASNGWGTYDDFVPWLEAYLEACEQYPKALVTVWR